MKIGKFLMLGLAALLFCGCAKEIIVAEALQLPVGETVYLKCNIWYQNPDDISSLNYQTGRILPFGHEVMPLSASEKHVSFKDASGVVFTIKFDAESMMIPVQEYIRRIFTTTPPFEWLKGIPVTTVDRIMAGQVVPGMTREEVILSFGHPAAGRTPSLSENSYLYYLSPDKVIYVVFQGDVVRQVIAP